MPVHFHVLADVPYDKTEKEWLVRAIEHSNQVADRQGADFLVHLGDMCPSTLDLDNTKSWLREVSGILQNSKIPVLFVPGDNDWQQNPIYESAGGADTIRKLWGELFITDFVDEPHSTFARDTEVDRHGFAMPQQFAFTFERVRFVGIHLVDGDYAEKRRHTDRALAWLRASLEAPEPRWTRFVVFGHSFRALEGDPQFHRDVKYLLESAFADARDATALFAYGNEHEETKRDWVVKPGLVQKQFISTQPGGGLYRVRSDDVRPVMRKDADDPQWEIDPILKWNA